MKWYRPLGNGGYEEIYVAPSLDCALLKRQTVRRNQWHLPRFVDTWEVHSVALGEPAAELFGLPAGYREIEDPHRRRLLEQSSGKSPERPAR